jgi:predicted transcriptional regulator
MSATAPLTTYKLDLGKLCDLLEAVDKALPILDENDELEVATELMNAASAVMLDMSGDMN